MVFISHCEGETFLSVSALRQDSAQTLPAKLCFPHAVLGKFHPNLFCMCIFICEQPVSDCI